MLHGGDDQGEGVKCLGSVLILGTLQEILAGKSLKEFVVKHLEYFCDPISVIALLKGGVLSQVVLHQSLYSQLNKSLAGQWPFGFHSLFNCIT